MILKLFTAVVEIPTAPTEPDIVTFGGGTLTLKLLALVVEIPAATAPV